MRFLEVVLNEHTWLFNDQRDNDTNQQKKGQHDNTLNSSAHISYLLCFTYVLSFRFQWDMVVMYYDTYVRLGVVFSFFLEEMELVPLFLYITFVNTSSMLDFGLPED